MDLFRRAGFDVVAWPVDYRAFSPLHPMGFFVSPADGLRRTDLAMKEWTGLLAYRLTGRTGSVFPAP